METLGIEQVQACSPVEWIMLQSIVQVLLKLRFLLHLFVSHLWVKPLSFSLHMCTVDVLHSRAPSQCHGKFKFIPQHLQHLLHAVLAITSKSEDNRPPNLDYRNWPNKYKSWKAWGVKHFLGGYKKMTFARVPWIEIEKLWGPSKDQFHKIKYSARNVWSSQWRI